MIRIIKKLRSTIMKKALLCSIISLLTITSIADSERTFHVPLGQVYGGVFSTEGITLLNEIPGEENDRLVIEAENFTDITSQPGMNSTTIGIAQEYARNDRNARDISIGTDKDASSGKFIHFTKHASYSFLLNKTAPYYIWVRMYLPKDAGWNFFFSMNNCSVVEKRLGRGQSDPVKEYFWTRVPGTFQGKKGSNTLDITWLYAGKRLDKIIVTSDKDFIPKEAGSKKSPLRKSESVRLISEWLKPSIVEKITNIYVTDEKSSKVHNCKIFYWTGDKKLEYSQGDLKIDSNKKFKIEAVIQQHKGMKSLQGLCVDYKLKDNILMMKTATKRLFFNSQQELCGIETLSDKKWITVIQPFQKCLYWGLRLFDSDQKKFFNVTEEQFKTAYSKPSQAQSTLVTYTYKGINVKITIGKSQWDAFRTDISLTNKSPYEICEVQFPLLSGIAVNKSPQNDYMMFPMYEPEIIANPATCGVKDIVYPKASMNWIDVFQQNAGICVTGIDRKITLTKIQNIPANSKNSTGISFTKINRIKSHDGQKKYTFYIYPHHGDWHIGADFYRTVFYSMFPHPVYPEWLKVVNCWYAPYLASVSRKNPGKQPPPYLSFKQKILDRSFALGTDFVQMWGQGSMDHACPTYYLPDPERGGENAFTELLNQLYKYHIKTGAYVIPNAMSDFYCQADIIRSRKVSDIPEEQRPLTWKEFNENRHFPSYKSRESKLEKYPKKLMEKIKKHKVVVQRSYRPMAFVSKRWQEYITYWIKRYVIDYGMDVIYMDTFGNTPYTPEYNEKLNMFGYGEGGFDRYKYIQSMTNELRKYRPEFTFFQEAVTDAYAIYAAPMTSGFHRNPEVYRYTFPDHVMFFGQANGGWSEKDALKVAGYPFLEGMKFDILRLFKSMMPLIWMRESYVTLFSQCRYHHTFGISFDQKSLDARLFKGKTCNLITFLKKTNDSTELHLLDKNIASSKHVYILSKDGFSKISLQKTGKDKENATIRIDKPAGIIMLLNSPYNKIIPYAWNDKDKLILHLLNPGDKDVKTNVIVSDISGKKLWSDQQQVSALKSETLEIKKIKGNVYVDVSTSEQKMRIRRHIGVPK